SRFGVGVRFLEEVVNLVERKGSEGTLMVGDVLPLGELRLPYGFVPALQSQVRLGRHAGARELPTRGRGVLAARFDQQEHLGIRAPHEGEQSALKDALVRCRIAVNRSRQLTKFDVAGLVLDRKSVV